jgi:hypothetical protein
VKTTLIGTTRAFAWAGVIALGGCAGYGEKISDTTTQLNAGAVDAAIASHEKPYEGSTGASRDLLYYMESGELLRAKAGGLDDSTKAWLEADTQVRGWENEARGNLQKSAGTLGAWLLNDSMSRYDGQDYEKVMLNTMLAENHLASGDWEGARVEIRKMYEREALIAALRDKQVEAIKNDEANHGVGASTAQIQDIKGYPVEIFNDPEVTQLRNSYQSAASHYLAGFVFEALNEPSLAAAGYRQAIELRPDVPMLKDGLQHLGQSHAVNGQTDVLVLVETGAVPARASLKVTVPVPLSSGLKLLTTAYPVIHPVTRNSAPASVSIGDAQVPAAVATNLDAMARRSLKDDMPLMIARSMVRMAVSGAAQEAAERSDSSGVGALIGLAIGVASAASASTDTREWRTLPAYISLARASVRSGAQTIAIDTPQGRFSANVTLNGPYAVVIARPLGNQLQVLASTPTDQMLRTAAVPTAPVDQASGSAPVPVPDKKIRRTRPLKPLASTSGAPG